VATTPASVPAHLPTRIVSVSEVPDEPSEQLGTAKLASRIERTRDLIMPLPCVREELQG
jgi:hypothetical protein